MALCAIQAKYVSLEKGVIGGRCTNGRYKMSCWRVALKCDHLVNYHISYPCYLLQCIQNVYTHRSTIDCLYTFYRHDRHGHHIKIIIISVAAPKLMTMRQQHREKKSVYKINGCTLCKTLGKTTVNTYKSQIDYYYSMYNKLCPTKEVETMWNVAYIYTYQTFQMKTKFRSPNHLEGWVHPVVCM